MLIEIPTRFSPGDRVTHAVDGAKGTVQSVTYSEYVYSPRYEEHEDFTVAYLIKWDDGSYDSEEGYRINLLA